MTARKDHNKLRDELSGMLNATFPGMNVCVEHSRRWHRDCVTFRWSGFDGLLPEERFHRLVSVISERFRRAHLAGFVWLELTPDETVDEHLKLPRSEDVAGREGQIYGKLHQVRFFDSLRDALGSSPENKCPGDFSTLTHVLNRKQFTSSQIRDTKLAFIGQGVYCDCQALRAESRVRAQIGVDAA